MCSIYSSKLFQSSKRKEKIQAAITDPRNSELVTQLSKYIDVSTVAPADDKQSDKKHHSADKSDEPSEVKKHEPIVFHPVSPNNVEPEDDTTTEDTSDDSDKGIDDSEHAIDSVKPEDSIDETDEPDDDVESATNTANIPPAPAVTDIEEELDTVTASAAPQSCHSIVPELSTAVDEIYGTLNGREETKGVSRIMVKEDNTELWIHYEDSVNLNNVMSNVILVLNSCGYYYLQFNRLARSENAIVFEISLPNVANTELPKEE